MRTPTHTTRKRCTTRAGIAALAFAALLLAANAHGIGTPTPPPLDPASARGLALAHALDPDATLLANAHAAIEGRTAWAQGRDILPRLTDLLSQTQLAEALLAELATRDGDPLAQSIRLVRIGTQTGESPPLLPRAPSEAALDLLARMQRPASTEEWEVLRALDTLDAPLRDALARLLDAYLAMDTASRTAFREVDFAALAPSARAALAGGTTPRPSPLPDVDLAPTLQARARLLDATVLLRDALQAHPATDVPPILLAPAFALDLAGGDDVYRDDYALLVDVGGNDTYLNNAGGSNLAGGACVLLEPHQAAALVDLGGDDQYGDGRGCGVNGAGFYGGVGFLLDAAGDDRYLGGDLGANGAVWYIGAGFLLDAGGDDNYTSLQSSGNGGGWLGTGFLLDRSGDDLYAAGHVASNGGAYLGGSGFLLDGGGNDRYVAGSLGTNGGSYEAPRGFLLDAGAGNDSYVAGGLATNGGAYLAATGLLLDEAGDDRYVAGSYATNGGTYEGGVGALLDGAGEDHYEAGGYGANGGGSLGGVSLLLDAGASQDHYTAGSWGTNGGASVDAAGLLWDAGGDDTYLATQPFGPGNWGTNGGASSTGWGLLLDEAGNDVYTAGSYGANGGGTFNGVGLLLDRGGNDRYVAVRYGANGGSYLGVGLLLDEGGTDAYQDTEGGTGADCSVFIKGYAGTQLDLPLGVSCGNGG